MRTTPLLVVVLWAALNAPHYVTPDAFVSAVAPVAAPTRTPADTPAVTPTPAPTAAPTPSPRKTQPLAAVASNDVDVFRGLESWVDVFDYTNDPATVVPSVRGMAERGVKTLYIESSRFGAASDIQYPAALGAALDEAKALGLRVVAWYPPALDDLERDVRRSLAAVRFVSPKGNRFDAFGADIEYTQKVPDHAERSQRAVEYSQRLRAGAGNDYPLAAIVIPPTFLDYKPTRWPNFPWSGLRGFYQVFMPMNYWTAFGKNPQTATDQTKRNAAQVKLLTGRPVHMIGGLAESADEAQVAAFVAAAIESGSLGGGLYDYATTRTEVWDELQALNR